MFLSNDKSLNGAFAGTNGAKNIENSIKQASSLRTLILIGSIKSS